jgi:DNA helicase-2/ATP-dependent DNA helicase PcrA
VEEAYNEHEESDLIINHIHSLLLRGRSLRDFAVMYRTNAQSRVLEEGFIRAQIPYKLVGATQFYKRREVKDVLAYLRLVHNLADSVSFNRVLNTPTRGIGAKTQEALQSWAAQIRLQPAEALIRLVTDPELQHPFRARALRALSDFGEMLAAWTAVKESARVGELLDLILEQTRYQDFVSSSARDEEEARDRWANVMELRAVAIAADEMGLTEFLEEISLVSDVDDLDEEQNRVTLLTLHAAKGLEFPVVFITGLEDGVLPHSRSMDDSESMAEERRLFYVGLTRAMDRVYLTHAFRRTFYGETEIAVPSRFLQDIPEALLQALSSSSRREQSKKRASRWESSGGSSGGWERNRQSGSRVQRRSSSGENARPSRTRPTVAPPPKKDLPPPRFELNTPPEPEPRGPQTARYRTGQTVRHAKFGEGTVIESKLTGNDEEVSVAFRDAGIKRLAASFAKLEIIDPS